MGIPRFFKLPKNKQFNYQPLFYNEKKEAREEREKGIAREMGIEIGTGNRSHIAKGSMREYFKRERKERKQSNLRLIIIAIILFFITYLLLFN